MGIDHRAISVGEKVFSIFGIIDLCISSDYQGKGIGSSMIDRVSILANEKGIDFLFLVADEHRLYEKNGFKLFSAYLVWLRIDEHKSYGVGIERIEKELMIKQIGEKTWENEPVDLLGYLF